MQWKFHVSFKKCYIKINFVIMNDYEWFVHLYFNYEFPQIFPQNHLIISVHTGTWSTEALPVPGVTDLKLMGNTRSCRCRVEHPCRLYREKSIYSVNSASSIQYLIHPSSTFSDFNANEKIWRIHILAQMQVPMLWRNWNLSCIFYFQKKFN